MTTHFDTLTYATAASACALVGAAFDIRSRRIPNFLTVPALAFGLLLHATFGGWNELGGAFVAALICGTIFFILFVAGGMGAGDVKLLAAVGCIAGLPRVGPLLILTSLAGGVMALVMSMMRQRFRQTISNMGALVVHHRFNGLEPHPVLNVRNEKTLRLPYAVAIAAGMVMTTLLYVVKG